MKQFKVVKVSQAVDELRKANSFRASNLTALEEGENYLIYSHATLIAKAINNGSFYYMVYLDNRSYSNTTSKYQHIIKKAFNLLDCTERKIYTEEEL
jgi:hypothetical protein